MQFLLGMWGGGGGETRKVKGNVEVDKCICLVSFQARFCYYYHYQYYYYYYYCNELFF